MNNDPNSERMVLPESNVSVGMSKMIKMINKTDEKLKLAEAELLRMEDEGGIALTKKQTAKISAYATVRKQIKTRFFGKKHRQPPIDKATRE